MFGSAEFIDRVLRYGWYGWCGLRGVLGVRFPVLGDRGLVGVYPPIFLMEKLRSRELSLFSPDLRLIASVRSLSSCWSVALFRRGVLMS